MCLTHGHSAIDQTVLKFFMYSQVIIEILIIAIS